MIVLIIFTVVFFISTVGIVFVSVSIDKETKKTDHIHNEVIRECQNHDNDKEEIILECDGFTVIVNLSITECVVTGAEHMGQHEEIGTRDVKVTYIEAILEDGTYFELPEKTRRYIYGYFNEW